MGRGGRGRRMLLFSLYHFWRRSDAAVFYKNGVNNGIHRLMAAAHLQCLTSGRCFLLVFPEKFPPGVMMKN